MRNMSGSSSGGFMHGILLGGGVVFFVAGIIIVAGIPGGVLGPSGDNHNGANAPPATTTSTAPTSVTTTATTTRTTKSTTTTTTPKTTTTAATTTPTTTATTTQPKKTVRYRVNVGGGQLAANGGPYWLADSESSPSRFGNARISGSKTNGTNKHIPMTDAVPAGTPDAVYQSWRYDDDEPETASDDTEMQYRFPVQSGQYEVRLYFVETFLSEHNHKEKGPRKFDVEIEGKRVLHNYDMYKQIGPDRGTMKSYTVTVHDGVLNVKFIHQIENPTLSGIEIVRVQGGKHKKDGENDDRSRNGVEAGQTLAAVPKAN